MAHLSVVLAHRLRGLVAGIEGFADLLNDTLSDADQRELAMKIMEGTARIESILADLQLYGERLHPVMLPVRVDELLRDLFVPLETDRCSAVSVDVSHGTASRMVLADPFLLRQVLLILVQNALEADRSGAGVRLCAEASDVLRVDGSGMDGSGMDGSGMDGSDRRDPESAESESAAQVEFIRFEVWNRGTIDVSDARRTVFMPFFTTKAHNLGVGLSIARRIARLHGASLELAHNDSDRGTCFALTIPEGVSDL
ncbi:MAG: HAMP domain-containing sensor histidine kinase [Rhodothermales bacterium]